MKLENWPEGAGPGAGAGAGAGSIAWWPGRNENWDWERGGRGGEGGR